MVVTAPAEAVMDPKYLFLCCIYSIFFLLVIVLDHLIDLSYKLLDACMPVGFQLCFCKGFFPSL